MPPNAKSTHVAATIIGYLITAAVIIAVPLILIQPDARSEWFWHRIGWTEFLAVLLWGYFGGFVRYALGGRARSSASGGVLPATGILITIYAIASFVLLSVTADPSTRWHLATQVLLLAATAIILVFVEYARSGATSGREDLDTPQVSIPDLCSRLQQHEQRFSSAKLGSRTRALHDSIKGLREAVLYSLRGVGQVRHSTEYRDFVETTERLCGAVTAATPESLEADQSESLRHSAEGLRQRIPVVSMSIQKKRD
jgi:hypothetical protein